MADKNKNHGSRPDLATLAGLVVALGGIIGGLLLEGGHIAQILQGTAAMIVFGGTLGAVMVTTPFSVLRGAAKRLLAVFFERAQSPEDAIEEIIGYATKARKNGIVSLETEADSAAEPFLRKALGLAVDGTDLQELRKMMELEIAMQEQRGEAEAKVFEAAGGYAPTIGIIGAVLGLIQVMQKLADIEEVGRGIGVAFVATVYGVGSANIFFLPACNKIRARIAREIQMKELMLEGIVGIVEGLNPKLIRIKLGAYLERAAGGGRKSPSAEQAVRAVEAQVP
jgi:chemotaxis protein MotA